MGITKDLQLVGQDYSWISSVFFFGTTEERLLVDRPELYFD